MIVLARDGHQVTVFEADCSCGGHARTVDVPMRWSTNATVPVDVGFMVCNTNTYSGLMSIFELLDVELDNSSTSFACLASLFADRKNIVALNAESWNKFQSQYNVRLDVFLCKTRRLLGFIPFTSMCMRRRS